MIVLLSGDGKYSLDGEELESVLNSGRDLFLLLRAQKYDEFSRALEDLHSYVKSHGRQVDVLRNADVVVPPMNCSPTVLNSIMGLQSNP